MSIDIHISFSKQLMMNQSLQNMLEAEYAQAALATTDINQHLPYLRQLADRCESVTEFGVRTGQSTRAFLVSNASQVSLYDLELDPGVCHLVKACATAGRAVSYEVANTLQLTINHTDLLFVDTLHTYQQLLWELRRHSNQVKRYIALHDTHIFGTQDESGHQGPGLLPAVMTWLAEDRRWTVFSHHTINNGLTVLERIR